MVTINVHLIFLLFNWGKIKLCSAKSLQSCLTLRPYGAKPGRFLFPGASPGKNTGVRCHALLQGVFPIQGSNKRLLLLHRQAGSLLPAPPRKLIKLCRDNLVLNKPPMKEKPLK